MNYCDDIKFCYTVLLVPRMLIPPIFSAKAEWTKESSGNYDIFKALILLEGGS